MLFGTQVHISEDIDFNYSLKRTCAYEVSELCKDMPHGHGRVIRCGLQLRILHGTYFGHYFWGHMTHYA